MRLIAATVRNYRIHQETSVAFSPGLTLISGENESGKSTLVEAIHRALFLRARTGGAVWEGMQSRWGDGVPEVEVRFALGDATYTVFKRFGGSTRSAVRVTEEGGAVWQGDDAEERLAALLHVAPLGGKRGVEERLAAQWGHLWVWQGCGGADPVAAAAAQHEQLVQQLQRVGGAATLQSELDVRVAALFAETYDGLFGKSGKLRTQSEWAQRQRERERAEREVEQARLRCDRLEEAAQRYEAAEAVLARSESELRTAQRELDDVRDRVRQVAALRAQYDELARERDALSRSRDGLAQVHERIRAHAERAARAREAIAPLEASHTAQNRARADLENRLRAERQRRDDAVEHARAARMRRDWAASCARLAEAKRRCEEGEYRVSQVRELERELQDLRDQVAALPAVDQQVCDRLAQVEARRARALAALEAAAPEVEVVSATVDVQVGEAVLPPGGRTVVVDDLDVRVPGAHLRIRPRGADTAALRAEVDAASAAIRDVLDGLGLKDVAEAAAIAAQRDALSRRVAERDAAWRALGADEVLAQYRRAQEDLAAARADEERRRGAVEQGGATDRSARDDVAAWVREEEQAVLRAEEAEQKAVAAVRSLEAQLSEGERRCAEIEQDLARWRQERDQALAAMETLAQEAGDEEHRVRELARLDSERGVVEMRLRTLAEEIEALQPEVLEADAARWERVLSSVRERAMQAERDKAAAAALLSSDGSDDPACAYAQAQEHYARALRAEEQARIHADAVALVHGLFEEKQRQLSSALSQPLAEAITGYLKPLFGTGVTAQVVWNQKKLGGIRVGRDDGGWEFGQLSGGSKEQVGAAVRLAMAEILARDYGGSLPVVFDDAFVNSDPQRVGLLLRMLDVAARRGLQVVVLTSHREQYTPLGASEVVLHKPAGRRGASA